MEKSIAMIDEALQKTKPPSNISLQAFKENIRQSSIVKSAKAAISDPNARLISDMESKGLSAIANVVQPMATSIEKTVDDFNAILVSCCQYLLVSER